MRHRTGKIRFKEFNDLFYKKNLTIKKIAQYFGVTDSAIGSFRHRYSLPPRGWSNGISPRKGVKISEELKKKLIASAKTRIGFKNPRWCGEKRTNTQGYILIRKPKHPFCDCYGFVREHRLVMEKHLGRFLKKNEVVHHINGNKQDNRLENLVVCSDSVHHSVYHLDVSINNLNKSYTHLKNMTGR